MFNYLNGFRGFTLPPEFSISMVKFLKRIFIWLPFSSIFKLKQEEKHDEKNKELSAMCVSYCHSINIWKSNECKALRRRTNIFGSYAFQSEAWLNSSCCYQLAMHLPWVESIHIDFRPISDFQRFNTIIGICSKNTRKNE